LQIKKFPLRDAYSILKNWTQVGGLKGRWILIWEYTNVLFVLLAFVADTRSAYLYTLEDEDSVDNVTEKIEEIKELLSEIGRNVQHVVNACS